jgi:protoporphyrinogen/coproporphyrinogen III oxidase
MTDPSAAAARRIIVIGGGITGLAAAHRLLELGREQPAVPEVLLLEAGEQLGGIISTERRDGYILEAGPDSFITDKPWGAALCRRLGLEDRFLETDSLNRRSFIVRGRKLLPVPAGFQLLAPSRVWPFVVSPILSWPGKLRVLLEGIVPPHPRDEDESLAGFVERRLGREALTRLAQPMIAGIYGADPRTLSLRATMPRFLEMERTHGSVIRAMIARRRTAGAASGVSGARYGLFLSLRDGMQTLVETLAERLPPECVRRSVPVSRLSRSDDGRWRVVLEGGASVDGQSVLDADAVCVALPAYRAAALLDELDPALAAELAAIPYASSATINLAYRRADVAHPMNGFGFVAPAVEKSLLLGCTFSSVKFPGRAPEGHVLLRAFLGEESLAGGDDAALTAAAHAKLASLLGIAAPPLFSMLRRHVRAMAQYQVGHLDRVAAIEASVARHARLALAGNAYRGIGIPDCIHSGEQAAERLMDAKR